MLRALSELAAAREVLYMLTWREIRIRYKQSVMGLLWALLMPLIITLAGIALRFIAASAAGTAVGKADVAAIAVKAIPWAFFISALRFGTSSLTANANLVTKIRFPRLVCPLSAVLTSLVDLVVATPLLLILLPALGLWPTWTALWWPVLILLLVVFTAGVVAFLAAANLFFRDVKYLVEVILTFAVFFTPVLYDVSAAGRWQHLLLLNPVAPILDALSRTVIAGQQPDFAWLAYSAAMAGLAWVVGVYVFRRLEPRFAESV